MAFSCRQDRWPAGRNGGPTTESQVSIWLQSSSPLSWLVLIKVSKWRGVECAGHVRIIYINRRRARARYWTDDWVPTDPPLIPVGSCAASLAGLSLYCSYNQQEERGVISATLKYCHWCSQSHIRRQLGHGFCIPQRLVHQIQHIQYPCIRPRTHSTVCAHL